MVTEWIVTEIDGKIASISARYAHFAVRYERLGKDRTCVKVVVAGK